MKLFRLIIGFAFINFIGSCSKGGSDPEPPPPPPPPSFSLSQVSVDNRPQATSYKNVNVLPTVRFSFTNKVSRTTVPAGFSFKNNSGQVVPVNITYANSDSTVFITPVANLDYLSRYSVTLSNALKSVENGNLQSGITISIMTELDSSRKFPTISDAALLDKVQEQTFKYFWDFAHPVSGLARERSNGNNNHVTSGGSGSGIMALIVGIERGFISRAEGLARMQKIVGFLKNNAEKFHGAFPHWMDGTTGAVVPFSQKDNGADIVETSYLIQGLLTARQYFANAGAEATLRDDINEIWNGVDWSWFRRGGQNVLYWHWSPNYQWDLNLPIKGWNECLITYVLAASSNTHAIPKIVYDNGWASNGGMIKNNNHYGYPLPLGPPFGGPLFFSHYSFLGIDPNGLADAYANYETQTRNHALINYTYCKTNPVNKYGYSDSVWGLTASDIPNSYAASSPTNDLGVIAPTAALSSFPYTPEESMKALKFFYYVLGDKIWKEYGFVDAFSLNDPWFASSFLAIDQGPIIVMIENYRTGLLWDLFTSCPEVQDGMSNLGFTAPYL